jgi:hypothetical protein
VAGVWIWCQSESVTAYRIAPAPVAPADQSKVDAFFSGFTAAPVTDFHSAAAAQDAVALTVTDGQGHPIRLVDVAFVRPGLGKIMFSPAQIYMLARHFRTVVLLYTNMTDPDAAARAFRRVTELEGIPIPSEIAGGVRIFAVGSPQLNVISYLQQPDVTLEQLELLRRHSATLGFDPLAADRWVFAHSQGVTEAVVTDHRLRKAGFPGFDRARRRQRKREPKRRRRGRLFHAPGKAFLGVPAGRPHPDHRGSRSAPRDGAGAGAVRGLSRRILRVADRRSARNNACTISSPCARRGRLRLLARVSAPWMECPRPESNQRTRFMKALVRAA